MSKLRHLLSFGLPVIVFAAHAMAQPLSPAVSAVRPDVKPLADALVAALNGSDPASAVKLFHSNCVATWANTEISRGHEGLRSFQQVMLGGPVRRVENFTCEAEVDDAVHVFAGGQTALATGAFNERFKQPGGRKMDLQGRWTVTLVKEGDQWLIMNLQLSVDPFANSVLNLARQAGWVVGVVSLLVGAGVGLMLARKWRAGVKV